MMKHPPDLHFPEFMSWNCGPDTGVFIMISRQTDWMTVKGFGRLMFWALQHIARWLSIGQRQAPKPEIPDH